MERASAESGLVTIRKLACARETKTTPGLEKFTQRTMKDLVGEREESEMQIGESPERSHFLDQAQNRILDL
jgi:hypothetical protein